MNSVSVEAVVSVCVFFYWTGSCVDARRASVPSVSVHMQGGEPDRHYVDSSCTKIYRTETIIYIKLSSQHTSLSLN